MSFNLIKYTPELDLKQFYNTCLNEGSLNNSSQKLMVDCFNNESVFGAYVLQQDNVSVGFSAYHSLDIMGTNCYRICARNYVLGTARKLTSLSSVREIMVQHQNTTAQFFIPQFINDLGLESNLFITTNNSFMAKQRAVHNVYMPTLVKIGLAERIDDVDYRGHIQTFWRINSQKFLEDLCKYPRW